MGTDVVELERIEAVLTRRGEAFARRVLSEPEWHHWRTLGGWRRVEFLAGRFAAKEAMAKAAGCGLAQLGMRDVALMPGPSGLMVQWLPSSDPAALHRAGAWRVSITHTRDLAFAVAIWETT